MARRRIIDPAIWDDEDVGSLSDAAFRLFIACISNADDYGKLEGSARRMKGIAFRYSNISINKVEKLLQEIENNVRSFHRYEISGREYIALLNWHRYQKIDKPSDSKIPDPEGVKFAERSANTTRRVDDHSRLIERKGSKEKGREDESSNPPPSPSTDYPELQAVVQQVKPGGNLTELDCFKAIARIYSEAHVIGAINKLASRSKYNQITPNYVRGMLERASKEGTLGEFLPLTVVKPASQDPPLDLYDVKYKKLWDAFEQEKKANGKSA